MIDRLEFIILSSLLQKEDFSREALPFLSVEYFDNSQAKIIYSALKVFFDKHNNLPTKDAVSVFLDKSTSLSEKQHEKCIELLEDCYKNYEEQTTTWLVEETEKWCQDRAIHRAVLESITILDGSDKEKRTKHAIPDLMRDALAVGFDRSIGHDYFEDIEARYAFLTKVENRIPFDLEYLNKATEGGIVRKTMNIVQAATNAGKSMLLCHLAANYVSQGLNVLYVTCEMAEEKISERIDANLLDVDVSNIKELNRSTYINKFSALRKKYNFGKLFVKEYPPTVANANHMRFLLEELKTKKNFEPDVLIIDYLNICASSRIKGANVANSYTLVKSIAEEIRGLGVEKNLAIWTATQTNREGAKTNDPDITNISESFGVAATADMVISLIRTPELDAQNQVLIKQLKNRYSDITKYTRFVLGVDRPRMKFFDVDQSAQSNIVDSGNTTTSSLPAEDNDDEYGSGFGQGEAKPKRSEKLKNLVV